MSAFWATTINSQQGLIPPGRLARCLRCARTPAASVRSPAAVSKTALSRAIWHGMRTPSSLPELVRYGVSAEEAFSLAYLAHVSDTVAHDSAVSYSFWPTRADNVAASSPASDCTAKCVIANVATAPCQCFSSGSIHTVSPVRKSRGSPPHFCITPHPSVTVRNGPSGWACHPVPAPGANATVIPRIPAKWPGSSTSASSTVPV